jgi:hypothetical protein
MRTQADLNRLHDEVVAKYPGGLTKVQFRIVTLESADEDDDGRVYPPSLANFCQVQSWLMELAFMDGLLTHWDDGSGLPAMHQPMRYKITDKGRAWLKEHYDANADLAGSLGEGYRAIRERVANGGPAWTPKGGE